MAIREYECVSCNLVVEIIIPTSETPDPTMRCPKCGNIANFKAIPSSFGLLTDNFAEQKIDVAIGKDADRRWRDISDRTASRDNVRKSSGQAGVSMVGRNEFVPLAETAKITRTETLEAVKSEGYKQKSDTPEDQKILGV